MKKNRIFCLLVLFSTSSFAALEHLEDRHWQFLGEHWDYPTQMDQNDIRQILAFVEATMTNLVNSPVEVRQPWHTIIGLLLLTPLDVALYRSSFQSPRSFL